MAEAVKLSEVITLRFRIVAHRDATELFGRHYGRVEIVHLLVKAIGHPKFFLIGREADAVTGAAVPFDRADFETFDLDAVNFFAGHQIADLETEQPVDIYEAERPFAIHRERPGCQS